MELLAAVKLKFVDLGLEVNGIDRFERMGLGRLALLFPGSGLLKSRRLLVLRGVVLLLAA